ncbi:class I SAM-dependent methyltransferase [Synechocystis salina]|uniref:Class I SAM-dependent methyltransferase n=1 Tax=Synechocystis salina LEGE 00031 TaxID=1828736 RepID=A0ABR9VPT7_9SYNC|nr:class I SAM-dependent methyltransferase [Synechocystis salina]MBE9240263.1 class I SAM-dependent methyltransferase [Synechocystis salina LEGE 00041]MBE9253370.1 class I SAM-dependent methyltransferase [Synechocystis salina LEGE 00031]
MANFPRPTEQTKQFFQQWQTYQQLIEHNYMAHRQIHQAVGALIKQQFDRPFDLLDLGCGDAQAIAKTLRGSEINSYTGVDLSPNALALAQQNLATFPRVELREADFLTYLNQANPTAPASFDLIHAGFSLHHLLLKEKEQFFAHCFSLLRPGGYLLIYDVFRQPHQDRQQYLQAYLDRAQSQWLALAPDQIQAIAGHIKECDFPELVATMAEISQKVGFMPHQVLFTEPRGFHHCFAFPLGQSGKALAQDGV